MNDNTDNKELAVALYYDQENAPRVTAKGEGELARRILEMAEEHNVPLERDAELVAMLAQIPLGDEIPEELYRAVAEVIAFAYILAGKFPPGFRPEQATE
jgi:flagellar biosynthesis protein